MDMADEGEDTDSFSSREVGSDAVSWISGISPVFDVDDRELGQR